MDGLRKLVDGNIDFQGQRLADRINQEALVLFATAAFLIGWLYQSMQVCMGIFGAGFAVALIFAVPPWPYLNKHKVDWLPSRARPKSH